MQSPAQARTVHRLGVVAIAILPVAALLAALSVGRIPVSLADVILALKTTEAQTDVAAIVHFARLPRALASLLVGACLGMAGAVLQGLFRNPLAGPQTLGLLGGAGFGGALAILLGFGAVGIAGMAFLAGLVAIVAVIGVARVAGGYSVLMIVLAGLLVGALAGAGTTLVQFIADPETQLPQLVYWLMGSFSAARIEEAAGLMPLAVAGGVILWGYGLRLDVMASGDEDAQAMGVNVARDRIVLLIVVTALCAGAVAVAGVIGWVGLVVPHAARFLLGPSHRTLIPGSALLGGAFLCLVDTTARSATIAELPVSAITAIIGAPLFLGLLVVHRRKSNLHA